MPASARTRRLAAATTIALAAGAMTACAAQTDSSGASDTDFNGQSIRVLFISSHEGAANWLAENFEKETGAKVDPVIVPYDQIGAKLLLDQQSGANTIDVAAPWYVSIGDLAAGNAITDLSDWIDSDAELNTDDFIPSIYDPYSLVDGKRYGVPFDGDTHVLFYNKEILAASGITDPPATWDEYAADVKKITAEQSSNGIYGAAVLGQKSPLILGASFANRLAGFGGTFVDADGKPTINSDAAVQAAEALLDVNDAALPTPAETDFGVENTAWFAGKVGFVESWTDLGLKSDDVSTGSTVSGKWGVSLLPVGGDNADPRASLVAGFTLVEAKNTKKDALAKKFIEYAASSEVNAKLITAKPFTGIDPQRKSSLDDATYGAELPAIQKANQATLSGSLAWPTGEHATELAQVLTDELAKLIAGTGGTAKETLDRVQDKWEKVLGDS